MTASVWYHRPDLVREDQHLLVRLRGKYYSGRITRQCYQIERYNALARIHWNRRDHYEITTPEYADHPNGVWPA